MGKFLKWLDGDEQEGPLLKAAIAHLWFVTIHFFEDGNGRIGRAIAEMCLARSDGNAQRLYSMSSQILEERKGYYEVLERTQAGSLDITKWLSWFLGCRDRAIEQSNQITSSALEKELFGKALKQSKVSLNDRQKKVVNKLFSGFEGKLTRDKWMKITKASSRTALRDIEALIAIEVVEQEEAGGRSTSYRLNRKTAEPKDAGDKWAQQDGGNDGNTARQIGTKFPIQELPKQVIREAADLLVVAAAQDNPFQQGMNVRSGSYVPLAAPAIGSCNGRTYAILPRRARAAA